ncbi:MAG TPA: glycosyltransferase, partial [Desulfosporosinus sp.]|nr:glycosyltransferase [Desulfosporosinus sp.]
MKVSLLTGGGDPHYAFGLLSGLLSKEIVIDFIGNDSMQDADEVKRENVIYYNLRGDQNFDVPPKDKFIRILKYYLRLIKYAATTDAHLFHILWLNKFTYFDMTLLNMYYKLLGKKLVYTAHNINIRERDGHDTLTNRLSLLMMYKLVNHIFVHTEKMKQQLINDFHIKDNKVSVIPFGINDVIPQSNLTCMQAKKHFNLEGNEKVILF